MLRIRHAAPIAAFTLLLACTDPAKMPSEAAIKGAESALATVKAEAAKYVPDQLKAVELGLAKAKDLYAKQDFKGALEAAKELPAKAQALAAAALAKKEALTKAFNDAAANLPQMIGAIKSRLDILGQAKKLPAGMDAAKLTEAKDGLASLTQSWEAASAKMKAGSLAEAAEAVQPLKAKAQSIMGLIGLPAGQ